MPKQFSIEVWIERVGGVRINSSKFDNILKTVKPDLILMDIHMDDMDGITCTKKIVKLYPDIKILALTMHDENTDLRLSQWRF